MSFRQDIGTDPRHPYIAGADLLLRLAVVKNVRSAARDLAGTTSVNWVLFSADPEEVESPTRVVEKSLGFGATLTDAEDGMVEVQINSEDTAGLAGDFYHELRVRIDTVSLTPVFGVFRVRRRGLSLGTEGETDPFEGED